MAVTPERAGLLTMLAVVLVFGVHSLVDWTWFVPGNACVALLCAGWLAARGPGELQTPQSRVGFAAALPPGSEPTAQLGRLRLPSLTELGSVRIWAVATIVAAALVGAWAQWQPLRAISADSAAGAALDRGNTAQALTDARAAVSRDPLSVNALFYLANVQVRSGDRAAARVTFQRAVQLQPANPASWFALASFNAPTDPQTALADLRPALSLDPQSIATPAQNEFVLLLRRTGVPAAPASPALTLPGAASTPAPTG